ncbi:MAG: YdcF family protein [Sulfurimonas sp.]|nr:YdcF family protein [Sulfurimonas sp.]
MEFGFLLKKLITFFIEPLGLIIILFVFGLWFLFDGKQKLAKQFLSFSFGFLLLFSYPPFSNYLVKKLENQYSKYDYKTNVKYIHVLGSGHNTDALQPISSNLASSGTKRVLEGIIIHKKIPNSKIIFTGYEGDTNETNAKMNSMLALALGVDEKNMILNGIPNDTRMEAVYMKSIVGHDPFVLVTSATHMPRSMLLFESMGMKPIPAPTDFRKNEIITYFKAPNIGALEDSRMAIHEFLGILWAKIRG